MPQAFTLALVLAFFTSCKQSVLDELQIVHFLPNNKYYVKLRSGEMTPGGVFDGTISRIALDKNVVVADVDRIYEGDPDGIYMYFFQSGKLVGPVDNEIADRYRKMLVHPKMSTLPVIEIE